MDVHDAISARRAYRSLEAMAVTDDLIRDLARHAQLAPSCFNSQPWRFVFVRDPGVLGALHEALSPNNAWMKAASVIIVVCGRIEDDCVIKDREYTLFDLGMAAAFLILRATETGLVAHPIAGFSPKKTHEVLGIPDSYRIMTMIALGRKAAMPSPVLTPKQIHDEKEFTFTVKSAGSYMIEFIKPPALDTAQPAPLTVTGGQGYTVTPLVKTAGNYVMLRFKYTAPVDAGVKGGMPLASGSLYDAETGELWMKDQNVYNGNVQSQDGITRQKPGIYFALISCSKEGGTWEATITE